MEVANIVLEYLKVLLNWPLLVFALALVFKDPISEFLKKIKKIGFPGGELDAAADEASSEVDEASISIGDRAAKSRLASRTDEEREQPSGPQPLDSNATEPEPSSPPSESEDTEERGRVTRSVPSTEWKEWLVRRDPQEGDVFHSQTYENLRKMGVITPQIAVQEAYQRVRLNARRVLDRYQPDELTEGTLSLGDIFERLAAIGLIGRNTIRPARRLDQISHTNREKGELSPSGALSFIDAAQKLDMLLLDIAPPSTSKSELLWRAERVAYDLADKWKLAETVSIWRTEAVLHVNVPATNEEIEINPSLSGFISDVQEMRQRIGVKVTMHFDSGKP